jgi:hypothetical protein
MQLMMRPNSFKEQLKKAGSRVLPPTYQTTHEEGKEAEVTANRKFAFEFTPPPASLPFLPLRVYSLSSLPEIIANLKL